MPYWMENRFYVKAKGVDSIIGKFIAHQERGVDFDKPVPWLKFSKRTLRSTGAIQPSAGKKVEGAIDLNNLSTDISASR